MSLDPTAIAGICVLAVAILFAFWAIASKKSVVATSQPTAPTSLTRALDDAKYAHADLIIGAALGTSHALAVSQALGSLAAKPAESPKA